jgi:hypothetical protein
MDSDRELPKIQRIKYPKTSFKRKFFFALSKIPMSLFVAFIIGSLMGRITIYTFIYLFNVDYINSRFVVNEVFSILFSFITFCGFWMIVSWRSFVRRFNQDSFKIKN